MERNLFLIPKIPLEDVKSDIDALLWSMKMYEVRRFHGQKDWEKENKSSDRALEIEPYPRLENDAEHTFLVCDAVLLLGGHFPDLDHSRCLKLAVIHDKPEIETGDDEPVGNNWGEDTHANCAEIQEERKKRELAVIKRHVRRLRPSVRLEMGNLYFEMAEEKTPEALFVKAVDKICGLLFIYKKKNGDMRDKYLWFSLNYARKSIRYFSGLMLHFEEVRHRLIEDVARARGITPKEVLAAIEQQAKENS